MDSLASAPFDEAMHHLHHHQNAHLQHLHHHMQQVPQHAQQVLAHHNRMVQEIHGQMTMMQHAMMHQAETMMNNMIGWNFPSLPQISQITHGGSSAREQHSTAFTHFPPLHHGQGDFSYEHLLRLDDAVKKRGVATADLSKLKKARFSNKDVCKQCGICQDNFAVGTKIIVLPCQHSYCEKEILRWFEQNRTCPTCRYVIEDIHTY